MDKTLIKLKTSVLLKGLTSISYYFRQSIKNKDENYINKYNFNRRKDLHKNSMGVLFLGTNVNTTDFGIYTLMNVRYKYKFLFYLKDNIEVEFIDDIDYSQYPECVKVLIHDFMIQCKK